MQTTVRATIPRFDLQKSAVENFNQYIDYLRTEVNFESLKKCRWAYEQYIKTCNVYEREQKRKEIIQERKEEINFVVGE